MPSPHEPVELVLRTPLVLRDAGDVVELRDPTRGEWARMAPWTRDHLDAICKGASVEELVAREPEREAGIRRLVMSLAKVGYLDIRVPAPALPGYLIRRELGRGGVGVAYLAVDPSGREVVVKRAWGFLHPLALTQAALAREEDVLRRVRSEHVVELLDAFEHDGHRYLVRGFAPGEPLTVGAPSAARARRVLDGLGAALDALHRAGFALADHKPGNLFDDGERVRLVDVGNARPLELRTRAAGTRGFAAPEREATIAADVHGLGRMVAFALTGRMFRDDPAIDDVLDEIEGPLRDALAQACALDPCARPSLAQARAELARALR